MTRHIQALILKKGERALYQGKIVVIEAVLDLNLAMVKDLASGEDKQVQISHLMAPPQEETSSASSFVAVNSPEAKEQAEYRRDVISPLLNRPGRTRADVKARAAEYNLHPNTSMAVSESLRRVENLVLWFVSRGRIREPTSWMTTKRKD
jgi:hypothetical protein